YLPPLSASPAARQSLARVLAKAMRRCRKGHIRWWPRCAPSLVRKPATLPLVALVRSDLKNLVYFLQEDREAPGHFIFYEIFANQADFDAHNAMPYVKTWFAELPALADGGVKVVRMEILTSDWATRAGGSFPATVFVMIGA